MKLMQMLMCFLLSNEILSMSSSEDHLVTSKLKALIWDYTLKFLPKAIKFTTPYFIKEIGWCYNTTRRSQKKIKRSC